MRRKDLSEKKWAVLEDLFYSALDESAVLKKHNVTRTTYEKWLRQKLFSRQFQQYTASLARRTALAVAKAETEVALRLIDLTYCKNQESARKACQNVLSIANRFFETVARINESPRGENRGDFGGKRGENGGNRGKKEEEKRRPTLAARSTIYHSPITNHQALAGDRDIFGLNSGDNHDYPAQNRPRPELTYEQASKIWAALADHKRKKEAEEKEKRRARSSSPPIIPALGSPSSEGGSIIKVV